MSNKPQTKAVAGAGNDPEPLRLTFHHQGSTLINSYWEAATNLVD